LTRDQFDDLDRNQDGLLTRVELGDTPSPTGCPAGKAAGALGDFFLLGIALIVLSALGRGGSNGV